MQRKTEISFSMFLNFIENAVFIKVVFANHRIIRNKNIISVQTI